MIRPLVTLIYKELKEYLTTSLFYLLSCLALGILGWFFFNQLVLMRENANIPSENILLIPFLGNLNFIFVFLIPVLTMKSLGQELRDETILILTQSKLSITQIILGKFISLGMIILLFLCIGLLFPFLISLSTKVYWPHVWVGLLGVFLIALSYCAIGLFTSTLTDHPAVCVFMSVAIILFLMVLMSAGLFWENFSLTYHLEFLMQGVLRPKDLIYFTSFISFVLYLTYVKLKNRVLFV